MHHSLLSRFQGVLVGSLLAELVSYHLAQKQCDPVSGISLQFPNHPPDQDDFNGYISQFSAWNQIATCGMESIIDTNQLCIDDWLARCSQTQPSLLNWKGKPNNSEVAVATLPLALFFHENQELLQQSLMQAGRIWQLDTDNLKQVWAIGIAISLILSETFNRETFIAQILMALGNETTALTDQLQQIQNLLISGADLETTITHLRRSSATLGHKEDVSAITIALSFYCFLYTPEDFHLCVIRAVRSGYHLPITAALTGALAGVYNGIHGIPVTWQVTALKSPALIQRQKLTEKLLAVWLGVYDLKGINDQYKRAVVAAPGIIQRR